MSGSGAFNGSVWYKHTFISCKIDGLTALFEQWFVISTTINSSRNIFIKSFFFTHQMKLGDDTKVRSERTTQTMI